MFFIFGSPRSGTTLLAQSLNAHTSVVVPNETDFVIPLAFLCDRVRDPAVGRELVATAIVSGAAFERSIGKFLTDTEVRECVHDAAYAVSAIIERIYARIAEKAGKRIAGDKSPNDLLFLRILMKSEGISPQTPIIHIVRDFRDVCASIGERGWVQDMDLYFPRFWNNANLYLWALYRSRPEQYLLLRYEDLVVKPETQLTRVFRHLGLPFEPSVLDPANRDPSLVKQAAHHHLRDAISPRKVGRYRGELSPEQIAAYERQAAEGLAIFGYAPLEA
jgi:hypothetical protein